MSELRSELETELRALDIAPAPVEKAMRAGRRLRHRRRFAVAAAAVAVVAIAAGVPVLTRLGAGPAPLPAIRHDPVVTEAPPGPGAPAGEIAQGTIGAQTWRATLSKVKIAGADTVDITGTVNGPSPADSVQLVWGPLDSDTTPTMFIEGISGSTEAMISVVDTDVAYDVLTFTDGQQLKLIPVSVGSHRMVAYVAPLSMTIASLTEYLGSEGNVNGQTSTAIPFSVTGQLPVFGLWLSSGQAAPPRATRVIGSGTADGTPWSVTAYEGPWGTCFVLDPGNVNNPGCDGVSRAAATEIIAGWGGNSQVAEPGYGSAAPGVARVVVSFSNGTTFTAVPVAVGNERLFAFPLAKGVSPTRWSAYSASGEVLGTGGGVAG
jgi:hypothetical protein